MRPRVALLVIVIIALLPQLLGGVGSLILAALSVAPWWLLVIGALIVIPRLFGLLAAIFIGREPAQIMLGDLAANVVRGVFSLILLPFRLLFRR